MNPFTHDPQRTTDGPGHGGCRRARGLHDDVETWTDTCSCEPEPRWQAVADESDAHASPDAEARAPGERR